MSTADPIQFLDLVSTLPAAPTAWADVSAWAGLRPESELELWSDESSSFTALELMGATAKPLADAAVAAKTFTVASTTLDTLTATTHSYANGDGPVTVTNSGGALPGGLAASTNYWIGVVDANTIKLYKSLADVLSGAAAVDVTSSGSGTNQVAVTTTATNRLRWLRLALLGSAGDGAVALTYSNGYRQAFTRPPRTLALALRGTVASGKISAAVYPLNPVAV